MVQALTEDHPINLRPSHVTPYIPKQQCWITLAGVGAGICWLPVHAHSTVSSSVTRAHSPETTLPRSPCQLGSIEALLMRSIRRGLESMWQGKAVFIFVAPLVAAAGAEWLRVSRAPGSSAPCVCSGAPANCSVAVLGSQRQRKLQWQEPQRPECWGLHYFICISSLLCGHLKTPWTLESITAQAHSQEDRT